MVETLVINKIVKELEKYFIKKSRFVLSGEKYELILFEPVEKYDPQSKFSLFLSAKKFDNLNQKETIRDLFTFFKETLSHSEYNTISRISIINSNDPFVKNINYVFAFREQVI